MCSRARAASASLRANPRNSTGIGSSVPRPPINAVGRQRPSPRAAVAVSEQEGRATPPVRRRRTEWMAALPCHTHAYHSLARIRDGYPPYPIVSARLYCSVRGFELRCVYLPVVLTGTDNSFSRRKTTSTETILVQLDIAARQHQHFRFRHASLNGLVRPEK